jgi:hypothetical protein
MLHFWLEAFMRAIDSSLAAIGKDPADLRFSVVVVVLVTLLVFIQDGSEHGWRGMRTRLAKLLTRDVAIVAIVCVFVFLYNMAREPYRMWDEQRENYHEAEKKVTTSASQLETCSANLQTEKTAVELLGRQITAQQTQISGQQTLIAGQQATSATQQSTFNLCVATLAQVNAPTPQRTTMVVSAADPLEPPPAKHMKLLLLLTNKSMPDPIRLLLWCDGEITRVVIKPASSAMFSGGAEKVKPQNPFQTSNYWLISMNMVSWTPENPLVAWVYHDSDDIGMCHLN